MAHHSNQGQMLFWDAWLKCNINIWFLSCSTDLILGPFPHSSSTFFSPQVQIQFSSRVEMEYDRPNLGHMARWMQLHWLKPAVNQSMLEEFGQLGDVLNCPRLEEAE